MKRPFRSLLIENVNIRTPGLHVQSLALHRHLPERSSVQPHLHRSSQALLYLQGDGWQTLARGRVRIESGTLVMIPPGVSHSFLRAGGRAPLCLAIDHRFRPANRRRATVSSLNRSELAQIRQGLAQLARLQSGSPAVLQCDGAALVLQIMTTLLRSAGWLPRELPAAAGQRGRALAALLAKVEPGTPLGEVIRRSGYQRDHLNSLVKRETGLTLGQYRAQHRLALAKRLLSEQVRVSSVAAAVGLPDQSYFSRWFRRQTGQRPSGWGRTMR